MSRLAAPLVLAALLLGCTGNPAPERPAEPDPDAIIGVLMASADAWNRGDLDGFMEPYENSARVSFAGGSGVRRGFDQLRQGYERGYWANGGPADSLSFEVLEVRPLGDTAALMLGRYRLSAPATGATTSEGVFSLVWVLTDEGWRITHDHTSAAP